MAKMKHKKSNKLSNKLILSIKGILRLPNYPEEWKEDCQSVLVLWEIQG